MTEKNIEIDPTKDQNLIVKYSFESQLYRKQAPSKKEAGISQIAHLNNSLHPLQQDYVEQQQNYISVFQVNVETLKDLLFCFRIHFLNKNSSPFYFSQIQAKQGVIKYAYYLEEKQSLNPQLIQYLTMTMKNSHLSPHATSCCRTKVLREVLSISRGDVLKHLKSFLQLPSGYYLLNTNDISWMMSTCQQPSVNYLSDYHIKIHGLFKKDYILELEKEFDLQEYDESQEKISLQKIHRMQKLMRIGNKLTLRLQKKKIAQLNQNLQHLGTFWKKYKQKRNCKIQINHQFIILEIDCQDEAEATEIIKFVHKLQGIQWESRNQSLKQGYKSIEYSQLQDKISNLQRQEEKQLQIRCQSILFQVTTQNINERNSNFHLLSNMLRNGDLTSLKPYWLNGLKDNIQDLLTNSQVYGQPSNDIINFFHLLDYKLAKFNIDPTASDYSRIYFKMNTYQVDINQPQSNTIFKRKGYGYDQKDHLMELLYPGICQLSYSFFAKYQIPSFWSLYQTFLSKIPKENEIESPLKKKLNYKHFDSFHKYFSNWYQISHNELDYYLNLYLFTLLKEKNVFEGKMATKKSLSQCFAEKIKACPQESMWQDTLRQIKLKIEEIVPDKRDKFLANRKTKYLSQISNERVMEGRCLGCSQFFFENMNVFDESICKVPVRVISSITNIRQYQSQLKKQICGMLNGFGGVILFDCKQSFSDIIAIGTLITQLKKEQYQQRINSLISSFYPKIEMGSNIILTFVPVLENPYNSDKKYEKCNYTGIEACYRNNQQYNKRQHLNGIYCARIKVVPQKNKAYFWRNIEENCFISVGNTKQTKEFQLSKIGKLIKSKFKKNSIINSYHKNLSKTELLLKEPQNFFEGECLVPDVGYQITQGDSRQQIYDPNYQEKYNYLTLIVIQHSNISLVKKVFSRLHVDCQIQKKFQEYSFKSARASALLYHNICFVELEKIISNNKQSFTFGGKLLLPIHVMEHLNFQINSDSFPFSESDRQKFQNVLNKQFPLERIRFFTRTTQKGKQFYAKTQTKTSTLFMYYYFNNILIKTMLKNPKNWQHFSKEEKQKILKQQFTPQPFNSINLIGVASAYNHDQ